MNHADLVSKVAAETDMSKEAAGRAVEAVAKAISAALTEGEEVRFSGLGIFDVSARAARQGRNPQTGETIEIAASKAARFRAGKALKDAMNVPAPKAPAKAAAKKK